MRQGTMLEKLGANLLGNVLNKKMEVLDYRKKTIMDEIDPDAELKIGQKKKRGETIVKKVNTVMGPNLGRGSHMSDIENLSMRPSFMHPFGKPEQDEVPGTKRSVCTSEGENEDNHACRDPNKLRPAEIQANLNMFMADQKAEMNANKILFLSPDEREKMEKAKMKVKQHFQGFFRRHMIKGTRSLFDKWIAFVEF